MLRSNAMKACGLLAAVRELSVSESGREAKGKGRLSIETSGVPYATISELYRLASLWQKFPPGRSFR